MRYSRPSLPGRLAPSMPYTHILLAVLLSPGATGAPVQRALGELALARGDLAFAACAGDAAAVRDTPAARAAADLVARLHGGADGSVAADADMVREADGRWRIERLRRVERDGPRCTEDLGEFVWRAAGGDWTLSVSRRYLTLRRAQAPALFFRYRPFEPADGLAWTYSGRAGTDAIHVVLRPRRCEDPVARRATDWAIEFTIGGLRYAGCAWAGEPR